MNRTYDLPLETVQRIDAAAAALAVYQSELVAYLLAHSLDQIEAGALAVPVKVRRNAIAGGRAGNHSTNHHEVKLT